MPKPNNLKPLILYEVIGSSPSSYQGFVPYILHGPGFMYGELYIFGEDLLSGFTLDPPEFSLKTLKHLYFRPLPAPIT
jgi:hypothetical protein